MKEGPDEARLDEPTSEADACLDEVCRAHGLEGDDRFLVLALLDRPENTWPACCETGCEPCMRTLHAAARALR
ncbi:MAG: hypothetical protein KF901_10775 [Myxococcales bacterium]|nr:hypothetical protein [Myxococcales bacterium]